MSRTKGQLEKFNFAGLQYEDLYELLSQSSEFSQTQLGGLSRFYSEVDGSWQDSIDPQSSSDDFFSVLQSFQNFESGVLNEIDRRIDEAREAAEESLPSTPQTPDQQLTLKSRRSRALREAQIWGSVRNDFKKSYHDYEKKCTEEESSNDEFVDPRRSVLSAYLDLTSSLGRRPFRKELEDLKSRVFPNLKNPKAISKAAERLGLQLGDSRIHQQLKKRLKHKAVGSGDAHCEVLRQTFLDIRISSEEAQRLKQSLCDSPFCRLIEIVGNPSIYESIESNKTTTTLYQGKPFNFTDLRLNKNVRPSELEEIHALSGSETAHSILVALKSFSDMWNRMFLWSFDFSWIHLDFGPEYERATDSFFLTTLLHASKAREPGEWLSYVAERPDISELVLRCWTRLSPSDILCFTPDSLKGAKRLICLFKSAQGSYSEKATPAWARCGHLAELDSEFRLLIEFLDPFDWLLKGEEYGFGYSRG